jgi:hypothetical protein
MPLSILSIFIFLFLPFGLERRRESRVDVVHVGKKAGEK